MDELTKYITNVNKTSNMQGIGLALILSFLNLVAIKADLIVETNLGKVVGIEVKSIIEDEKYYSFMGIPYGKAPVGDLRFKEPQPHDGWLDVLEAKTEKKPCAQNNLPIRQIKNYGFFGQEDCLHLSVHTPKLPASEELNLPVIIFLYNEQFKITHNASRDYGPDFFMKEDVIFVTISHRVGPLGFISFEDNLLPGNNGIRDVILGLEWLHKNIYKFGGDPLGITLMGVDGGAALVDILIHSPKSKGLFKAAILQSGTAWNSMHFPNNPRKNALALAEVLEKKIITSAHLIEEFASESALTITGSDYLAIDTDEGRNIQRAIMPFSAILEHEHPDAVITKPPEDLPIDINIPIMVGYNSKEGLEMCERYLRKPQYLTFADRDFIMILSLRVGYRFEINSNMYHKAIKEIKDFYFDEGYVKVSSPGEYITYIGDIITFYPIDYAVRKYVNESKSSVYYYTFDYSGELNLRKNDLLKQAVNIEGTWGAATGDELCYLTVCKPIKHLYKKLLKQRNAEELQVIRNMVKLWSNFAKYGNPTPPGSEFTWTPATKENKEILVISDELQMKTNLFADRVKFWDDFFIKYKKHVVNGVVKGDKDEL